MTTVDDFFAWVRCDIDVNSRSSAWQGKCAASSSPRGSNNNPSLAGDTSQTSDEPNCNQKFKYDYIYLNFDVFALYIYLYVFAHTSCTLAYNTSRHCTHTSHR